jgi:alpha-tubulin suppressor-like RCC1 family protein
MITQDNKLMGWGANWCGGVGNGNKEACTEPVEIPLPQPATTKEIRSMAAGWHHTLCLMEDGSLFAWGDNSFGQLGVGDNISRYAPVELRMPNDLPVTQVTCGKGFSLAVTEDGTLFSWGENSDGQLGRGETTNQNTPQKVNLSDVLFMSAGRDHVYAKTPTATYAWGYNVSRQFGFSDADNRETPTQVSHLPDLVKIFCGGYHNLGLDSNGNLWSWGRNGEGQLGLGDLASHDHPEKIPGLPKMVSAAAGMEHSLALTEDKRVFAWGENSQGQLGISSSERYVLTPTEVSMPDVAFVFAGVSRTFQKLYFWLNT